MKIGVDGSCWTNKRGYGRYTRELFTLLSQIDQANEYRFFMDEATSEKCSDLPKGIERVVVRTSSAATEAAGAAGNRSPQDIWAMSEAVRRHGSGLDLFYYPSVYTFFPLRGFSGKVIVTIHDTIAERFPKLIFPNRKAQLFWDMKTRLAVRQADVIATVSETAKRAIMAQFKVPETKVKVIPDAVGSEFYPIADTKASKVVISRYGIADEVRFLLYVGGISPHKNLAALVDAFTQLVSKRDPALDCVQLVIVGDFQSDVFFSSYPSILQKAKENGVGERIRFTGFVPDDELVHFYNAAEVLVLPSFDEGFGLPVVEAMACGTPVAASRAGSLPEVVGDAGRFFDPHQPETLRDCLREILLDGSLRHELSIRGLARAKQFTWEGAAQAALATFAELGKS